VVELYTSHWRNGELGDLAAVSVSISRGRPRWSLPFSYRRYDELAPSDATWALEDLGEFERSYLRQLEELGAGAILERLEWIGGGKPCICLCWERPHEEFCHRWVLARYIEQETGIVVPELEPSDLPQREGAAEMRLF
jgi:hypothetical protein